MIRPRPCQPAVVITGTRRASAGPSAFCPSGRSTTPTKLVSEHNRPYSWTGPPSRGPLGPLAALGGTRGAPKPASRSRIRRRAHSRGTTSPCPTRFTTAVHSFRPRGGDGGQPHHGAFRELLLFLRQPGGHHQRVPREDRRDPGRGRLHGQAAPVDLHLLQQRRVDAGELPQHLGLDPLAREDELALPAALAGQPAHQVLAAAGADAEGEDAAAVPVLPGQLQHLGLVADLAVGEDHHVQTVPSLDWRECAAAPAGCRSRPNRRAWRGRGRRRHPAFAGSIPGAPRTGSRPRAEADDLEAVARPERPQAQLHRPARFVDGIPIHGAGAIHQEHHPARGRLRPLPGFRAPGSRRRGPARGRRRPGPTPRAARRSGTSG